MSATPPVASPHQRDRGGARLLALQSALTALGGPDRVDAEAGDETWITSVRELAEHWPTWIAGASAATVRAYLCHLEKAGLVSRSVDQGRRHYFALTVHRAEILRREIEHEEWMEGLVRDQAQEMEPHR